MNKPATKMTHVLRGSVVYWYSFACAPSVHVHSLMCSVSPFCYSVMAQTPIAALFSRLKTVINLWQVFSQSWCMLCRMEQQITTTPPREKITYSMNTCNVVLTSPTGTSSQYLMTDVMCYVEGIDKNKGLQYLRRKTTCCLMYVYCSVLFVSVVSL